MRTIIIGSLIFLLTVAGLYYYLDTQLKVPTVPKQSLKINIGKKGIKAQIGKHNITIDEHGVQGKIQDSAVSIGRDGISLESLKEQEEQKG